MKFSARRAALLTGISISVFGIAAQASAQTVVYPGIGHHDTTEPIDDLLLICDIGDECFFGVKKDGSGPPGPVYAVVDSPENGRIEQLGTSLVGDVNLSIENLGNAEIAAHASADEPWGGLAQAGAVIRDGIIQFGVGPDDIALELNNEGGLLIDAVAAAYGGETGIGNATVSALAVHQLANSTEGGLVTTRMTNSGSLRVAASALATGGAVATSAPGSGTTSGGGGTTIVTHATVAALVGATGILQEVGSANEAIQSLANSGMISVSADAAAQGGDVVVAQAGAWHALWQVAGTAPDAPTGTTGPTGTTTTTMAISNASAVSGAVSQAMENTGSISVAASAKSLAEDDGFSIAAAAGIGAMGQFAYAPVTTQIMRNEGDVSIVASATAVSGQLAGPNAMATASDGMLQFASASTAVQTMHNSGQISIVANAKHSAEDAATAFARAVFGMEQVATGTSLIQTMANDGSVMASANATALATGERTGLAVAGATAFGLNQLGLGVSTKQILSNSGTISVVANAIGAAPAGPGGDGRGGVASFALGARQFNAALQTQVQTFDNSGAIDVEAYASMTAFAASGAAAGAGYQAFATGQLTQAVSISNSGTVDVYAQAIVDGKARADAVGIHVNNAAGFDEAAPVEGAIINAGVIDAIANADGEIVPLMNGRGTTAITTDFGGSSAFATGIQVVAGVNNMTISNSGAINVDAIVAHGDQFADPDLPDGVAVAKGIVAFANYSTDDTTADDLLTINNSGSIVARESIDGGATWRRGLAITIGGVPERDVRPLPNRAEINLLGGYIYGDIALRGANDDVINVVGSETAFDGIINPNFMPPGGVANEHLDSGLFGLGTLNINNGGALYLMDLRNGGDPSMYDGPSYAFINKLDMTAPTSDDDAGTIIFGLEPAGGGDQNVGSYGQVFADDADIEGGTLKVRLNPINGLFADEYFWDNVIDSNHLNGEFALCAIGGKYAGSVLLDFTCAYDGSDNVDLNLKRVAFDAVPGINRNGAAVGAGLESIYSDLLTGAVADMLGDLFRIADTADYNAALNQLSGSSYANFLQSFSSLGVHYNNLAELATNCNDAARFGSSLGCNANQVSLWGQLDKQQHEVEGDAEAGKFESDRSGALIGVNVSLGEMALIGLSAGVVSNRGRDQQFSDSIDAEGYQLGAYAVFDPGTFYVKGVTTYSRFDGKSARRIDFSPFGGTFAGTVHGDPDVNLWTAGLHTGARLPMGRNAEITPYFNVDYSNAELKGFAETGLDGANLTIHDQTESRTFLTGGVKWATSLGAVIPQVNLGYRYGIGDRRSNFKAACPGDGNCRFDIISASEKRGTLLAGLSVGGLLGPLNVRLGYQGEFNGDKRSHSGNLHIALPLGGRPRTNPGHAKAP